MYTTPMYTTPNLYFTNFQIESLILSRIALSLAKHTNANSLDYTGRNPKQKVPTKTIMTMQVIVQKLYTHI